MTMTKMDFNRIRLRKAELFAEFGYKPHPAQRLVHRSKAKRRVVACGVRFGKSMIGAYECVAALLEPRESARGWLCSPTYDLTGRIFKRVVEVVHTYVPHRVKSFDARTHTIEVWNLGGGVTELRAKSTDKPVSLLGEALDFVVIDEAAKVREDVWAEHIAPRLLDRNGWALFLSTPDGGGWFYKQFLRAKKKKDHDYEGWQFPTSRNPHIDAALIEAERGRLSGPVFDAQYLARFVDVPIEPCDLCLGPRPNAPCAIDVHDDEEPRRCPECNGYIGEDGLTRVTIWPNGETYTMVVRIQDGPKYKNAYRGPVRSMRSESNMRPARELVIHSFEEQEPVPLPKADEAVSSRDGADPACEQNR
jgi:hypothetical protein